MGLQQCPLSRLSCLAARPHARCSTDAVLADPPDQGLHMGESVMLSAADLVRELRMSQDTLLAGLNLGEQSQACPSLPSQAKPCMPYATQASCVSRSRRFL